MPVPERDPETPGPIDPAVVEASFGRLSAILGEMMLTVADLSSQRCPYRDRLDRCTAKFGCRNQRPPAEAEAEADDRRMCGGDDKLDYRSAWETS